MGETLENLRRGGRELWSGGRGWILLVVATGWFLALSVRLTIPVLLPYLQVYFDIDLTTAGVLIAILWASFAFGGLPGGVVADWIGERNIMVVSMALTTVAVLILAAAPEKWTFFVGTFLFGLGSGLYTTTRFTVISDIYPDLDGVALGLVASAGNFGATVVPVVAGFVAIAFGWRFGFGMAVPFLLATVGGLWFFIPESTSDPLQETDDVRGFVRHVTAGVSQRSTLLVAGAMLLMSVIYQGFTGFYPTYLTSIKGLDSGPASVVYGLFFAGGIVLQPLAGFARNRFGTRATLSVITVTTILSLGVLPYVTGSIGLVVLTVVLSVQLGFWPVSQAYVINLLPDDMQGTGFGLLRMFYLGVASVGSIFVGRLGDLGMFDEAFWVLAGVAGCATGLCLLLAPVK